MPSWLQRQASSHEAQLAATAVLSGIAVASSIFAYQGLRRKEAVERLKASIPKVDDAERVSLLSNMQSNHAG